VFVRFKAFLRIFPGTFFTSVLQSRPPPFNPDTQSTEVSDAKAREAAAALVDDKHLFNAASGSFTSAPSNVQTARPPPSYDEIYGQQKDTDENNDQHHHHHQQQQQPQQQQQRRRRQQEQQQISSVTGTGYNLL